VPKVEDMSGFSVSANGCRHRILFFGTGGYYVICSECSFMWVAKDPMSDAPDPDLAKRMTGLSDKDKRCDPLLPLDDVPGFEPVKG
jgi:hypothetical protein